MRLSAVPHGSISFSFAFTKDQTQFDDSKLNIPEEFNTPIPQPDIQHQINTIEKQELSEQDKSVLAIIKPMVENIQNYIQYFNVGTFFELWTKKKQHKKEIKAAKDIILVINACTNPHIRELHSQTTLLVSLTVASSSLPLILYLSPLMILFLIIIAMQGGISRQIQAAIIHLQQRKNKTV